MTVLFVGLLISVEAGALGQASVDGRIVRTAHTAVVAHAALLRLAKDVTVLGAPVVVDLAAAVVAIALWAIGRRDLAGYLIGVRLVTTIADTVLKAAVGRDRPHFTDAVAHATGGSFPSGHSADAASFYLPIAVILLATVERRAGRGALAVATAICLAVAASRVLLGVHYPSDVIAGLALGVGVSAAGWWLVKRRQ
jgi:membrane-associated phospholipid phosphatase